MLNLIKSWHWLCFRHKPKDEEFTAADVLVQTYTEDGALTDTPATISATDGINVNTVTADGKNFTVTIGASDSATYTLSVQVVKGGVGAASPAVW